MRLSIFKYVLVNLLFVSVLGGCGQVEEAAPTAVSLASNDLILPTQPGDPTPTVRVVASAATPTETAVSVPTVTATATLPTATPSSCTPDADGSSYTVQAGDTLASIARKVNGDINQIVAANCLEDPNLLHVGQILYLPQSLSPTETPSSTPTSAPTATLTATPTPDLSLVAEIHSLDATADVVRPGPGDSVTVSWEAEGSAARLCAVYAFNATIECMDVPLQGQETLTLRDQDPVADHWVDYELEVRNDYLLATESIRVLVECHNPWFRAGLSSWCPGGKVQENPAIAQSFENGLIITTNNYAQIFFDDAAPACRGINGLGGVTADTESLTPPDGRFLPAPSIAPLWLGDLRGGDDVRERLGWATAPAHAFTQQIQCEQTPEGSGDCFVTSGDGRVYTPHTITGAPGADGLSVADGTCHWPEE